MRERANPVMGSGELCCRGRAPASVRDHFTLNLYQRHAAGEPNIFSFLHMFLVCLLPLRPTTKPARSTFKTGHARRTRPFPSRSPINH